MRSRILTFIVVFQSVQFLAHWFLYETWTSFWGTLDPSPRSGLQAAVALLSISFLAASLLAFRSAHIVVRLFYTAAAAWLGVLSFCFGAACTVWILYLATWLTGLHVGRRPLVAACFGLALGVSLYGIINAAWTRVHRLTVRLPNLPNQWRGRVAALVSDTHLGHVRNYGFIKRIARSIERLRPDIVFITGDVYDGTRADLDRLAEPWSLLSARLGAYFITGNHEEFSDREKYIAALERRGVRVLRNEKVTVDGLQIVGVHFTESADPQLFQSILRRTALDHGCASILLKHSPSHLAIAEEAGISLQLSGHTHGGQFFPYTWITSRIYGRYVHGLQQLGKLTVYITWGAGTWGPPMRVGTKPEIAMIRFE